MTANATTIDMAVRPAWNLDWLTPPWCRMILVLVLAAGFLSHLHYLHNDCPIDLSGDEAQYWDWSRNLDWSYYSKGPLVAYIIRASCAVFGDTMPAVRYPALVLSVATSIVTYLLTRKLFGSERLALGAVLLFHVVPMFIAGSVLMTIDPPMFFCWALATYFAASAIFDDRPWMWTLVGIAIGVGFLAKYAALLWFVGAAGFVLRSHGRKSMGIWLALLIACVFTIPVVVWNIQHDWVSFRHVATQTGAAAGRFSIMNLPEMIGGQIGAVGPTFAVLMTAAVVFALRRKHSGSDPHRPKLLMLAWIGLAFLLLNAAASLRTKIQPNWPAPAYFTLTILIAYFLGTRLQSLQAWKPWRGWFYAMIVIGILVIPIAHDTSILYPLHPKIAAKDPLVRLRGWQILGQHVSEQLLSLGEGAFVFCDDYQQTAETAFYVDGQPKTYCAGPYLDKPKRLSQYDMWPDRRLDATSPLVGRNAIYVGKSGELPNAIVRAFERVEKLPLVPVQVRGVTVKTFKTWRCYDFKGMQAAKGVAF